MVMIVTMATHTTLTTESPSPTTKQPTTSSMPQHKLRRLLTALHSRLQVTSRLVLPLSFSCRHVLFHSRD